MKKYLRAHKTITNLVRLQTVPLGACLIKADEPWPENSTTEVGCNDGYALCQWINHARRANAEVWVKAEKIACAPSLMAFGFKKMKDKDAYAHFLLETGYAADLDIARKQAAMITPLPGGAYQGVLVFPLKFATRKPDVIWIYGTSAQISHLTTGWLHRTGRSVKSTFGTGLSCRKGFSETPQVVLPGRGDRLVAGTGEHESFFSLPESCLKDLVAGITGLKEKGVIAPFAGPMPYPMLMFPAMTKMVKQLIPTENLTQ